jgi:hypothetical protein
MSIGGRREGAGRPALPGKVTLTATVQQQHLDYLRQRAYRTETTVSEVLRRMIESASACIMCDPDTN